MTERLNSRRDDLSEYLTKGDINILSKLLQGGFDPNQVILMQADVTTDTEPKLIVHKKEQITSLNIKHKCEELLTLLDVAIKKNNIDGVKMLFEITARPVTGHTHVCSALHTALDPNVNNEILELLLQNNDKLDALDFRGDSPLMKASRFCALIGFPLYKDKLNLILQSGANANVVDWNGTSPLMMVSAIHATSTPTSYHHDCCVQFLKLLCDFGADINLRSPHHGTTALHEVAKVGCSSSIEFLLERGAKVTTKDNKGNTPMLLLINNGPDFEQNVEMFLAAGADINEYADTSGLTLLDRAGQDIKVIDFLLNKGADINHKDKLQATALFRFPGHLPTSKDIIQYMCKRGADVNASDCHGFTPLLREITTSGSLVDTYLNLGAELSRKLCCGAGPLHITTRDPILLSKLVLHHISLGQEKLVNSVDDFLSTPLHWAVYMDNEVSIKILHKGGADSTLVDSKGRTPIALAAALHYDRLVDIFHDDKWLNDGMRLEDRTTWKIHVQSYRRPFISTFIHDVIKSPIMGLNCDVDENQEVGDIIISTMKEVEQRISEKYPIFKADLQLSGSVIEGTKCGKPDEFDIIFRFTYLSKCFKPKICQMCPCGYVYLRVEEEYKEELSHATDANGYMNSALLINQFFLHIGEELQVVKQDKKLNLLRVPEIKGSISDAIFLWFGATYKMLQISVDIVPTLAFSGWTPDFTTDHGIDVLQNIFGPQVVIKTLSPRNCTLFRVSVAHWEQTVIRCLSPAVRKAYMVVKSLLNHSPHMRLQKRNTEEHKKVTSYMLKSSFLCSLELEVNMEKYAGDDDSPLTTSIVAAKICEQMIASIDGKHLCPYFLPQTNLLVDIETGILRYDLSVLRSAIATARQEITRYQAMTVEGTTGKGDVFITLVE